MEVAFLEELCDMCAPVMVEGFNSRKEVFNKSSDQPTTFTDLRVNEILYARLLKAGFKESEIISEETPAREAPLDGQVRWIIDPLDGTREFIAGVPEFALSIAYLEAGRPAAAAVCNPVKSFRVTGAVGRGLFVNSRPKGMGPQDNPIVCSRTEYSRGLLGSLEREVRLQPVGSVAYKLALVAGGRARATVSYEGKNSWDIAGGVFLIELSGGLATALDGERFSFQRPLARFEAGLVGCSTFADYQNLYGVFVQCRPR